MTGTFIRQIIAAVSYVCAALLLCAYPLRARMLAKRSGACLLPLTRRKNPLYAAAVLCSAALLVLLFLREFTLSVTAVLYASALLALELAGRDTLYKRAAGVYEHLLIVDGRSIAVDEIISVEPRINGKDLLAPRVLKLVCKKSGGIFVSFENETERNAAAGILKKRLADKGVSC